ncbi:MAG: type I restriction enzyme HsdR N-terminal domain-containing protein [Nitrospinae bacterium]|nr:type I restriction enzyme HsdR N-terminal domain-containing protein [Nitrospinota bacterium]
MIDDIIAKRQRMAYKNEEHVRIGIVLRLLQKAGWDIFDPAEVYLEFSANRNEDKTKVDIAIFANSNEPTAFIEVKSLGSIRAKLQETERQLRDYNRNNTAPFSIITDGEEWRFYFSQTGGEFSEKCFRTMNICKDGIEDVELTILSFLSRQAITSGKAREYAENYLKLTKKQKTVDDSVPIAKRIAEDDPDKSWVQALIDICSEKGFEIDREEAKEAIKEYSSISDEVKAPEPKAEIISQKDVPSTNLPKRPEKQHMEIPISHINRESNYAHKKIIEIELFGQSFRPKNYNQLLLLTSKKIYEMQKSDFHKCTELVGRKRKYFSKEKADVFSPEPIGESGYYVGTNESATSIVKICYMLLAKFGYVKSDLVLKVEQAK